MQYVTFILTVSLLISQKAVAQQPSTPAGGYIIGNFGVAAQITEHDGPHIWAKVNPPRLGEWLEDFAQASLWIESANHPGQRLHLRTVSVSRLYPDYQATFDVEGQLQITVRAFAPLGLDSEVGFLPTVIVNLSFKADHPWRGRVGYALVSIQSLTKGDSNARIEPWTGQQHDVRWPDGRGIVRGSAFLGMTASSAVEIVRGSRQRDIGLSTTLNLSTSRESALSVVFGRFDSEGRYTRERHTAEALLASVSKAVPTLEHDIDEFEGTLPRTGDELIDRTLRWNIAASILLTKADRAGDLLIMAYAELNQRDNFWASGIHLVLWKSLEARMIAESIQAQLPSGRLPTTILPVIDRRDDIDISEYFVLRIARFYRWYRDPLFLQSSWPAAKKAIDYLASRDTEGVGVPRQISYWADWKDVPAVQGRRYAPHFDLAWIATLRAGAELAAAAKDLQSADRYAEAATRASAFVNREWSDGGLWTGHNYADRWDDGQRPGYVLQDQVVGAWFKVIPNDRVGQIYQELRASETRWGIRETWPYLARWTQQTGGSPGNYHNGGIWPYWNYIDAGGRFAYGYSSAAERLIRELGQADLDAQGDAQLSEYLNGDSGQHRGFASPGQCADAVLFSTLYFGAFGLERSSPSQISIHVRLASRRDFSTTLVLPDGPGTLQSHAGNLIWQRAPGSAPTLAAVDVVDQRGPGPL